MTFDDVAEIASGLPEAAEAEHHGGREWSVANKAFAWERPFSKADIKRFGDEEPPSGPILAVRVEDLGEKAAMLARPPEGFFTIPHFDGYPILLIQLDVVRELPLREALVGAWLACAPRRTADDFLTNRSPRWD